jgi:hypothetical protein
MSVHPTSYRFWSIVLIFVLVWDAGCTVRKTKKIDPATVNPAAEMIVGITTKAGQDISFDPPGGAFRDDAVHGRVKGADYVLPISDVQRLWISRTGTSTVRTIGLIAGIAAAALVTVAVIIAATKESCPFVYSWDGERYVFDAEPYGGAIARGLERDDLSELEHLRADNGTYRLLVTNEVDETQYTNSLELWVVDHAPDQRVVADEQGNLRALKILRAPIAAKDSRGTDLLPWLHSTDRLIWEPEAAPDAEGKFRREIILTFPKERNATNATLVVNSATGLWGSYMIKKMVELHGHDTKTWLAALGPNSEELQNVERWIAQEEIYRLKVEVEEADGWHHRGSIPPGGPLVAEDRVIPLDVRQVRGDQLRIRLRPPAGFWALNSFAVAYEQADPVRITSIKPVSATTSDGRNVLPDLLSSDERYYAMPNIGDRAELTFKATPEQPGMKRTIFLHSRGWYELHLSNQGPPATSMLEKMNTTVDGAAQFAAAEFAQWQAGRR